jgi:hypothetical protein
MDTFTFSSFEKSTSNLEGYISQFANDLFLTNNETVKEGLNLFTDNSAIYQKYTDLSNNIANYLQKRRDLSNNDLIDQSGNMLYKKNMNFKETIPPLKDAVLEDTINIMNYNNYMYTISGIAIGFLVIGIIIIKN